MTQPLFKVVEGLLDRLSASISLSLRVSEALMTALEGIKETAYLKHHLPNVFPELGPGRLVNLIMRNLA